MVGPVLSQVLGSDMPTGFTKRWWSSRENASLRDDSTGWRPRSMARNFLAGRVPSPIAARKFSSVGGGHHKARPSPLALGGAHS